MYCLYVATGRCRSVLDARRIHFCVGTITVPLAFVVESYRNLISVAKYANCQVIVSRHRRASGQGFKHTLQSPRVSKAIKHS